LEDDVEVGANTTIDRGSMRDTVIASEATLQARTSHIACNNAGVPMHGTRLIDVPPGDWEFVIGVNIWGIIHGIRHFVPAILKHGEEGHIVNTASVAGFRNRRGTNQGPYSMNKYAALSLSEALEHELEGTNVGVSVLCPGPINTNIARGARNRPDHMGGPQVRANEEAVLAERLATTGLDPKKVGERVVDAIRSSPQKRFRSPCSSCSFTNGSAARSPTAAFTTALTPITSRPASSKPPTIAPTKPFNRSSISLPPDLSAAIVELFLSTNRLKNGCRYGVLTLCWWQTASS
jgi:NAD(P)-dependent dehydrogenase (short-subunit alcohol dehydrogenase family)